MDRTALTGRAGLRAVAVGLVAAGGAPAAAMEPWALAPGPPEFRAAADELEQRVADAEAAGRTISRLHNAWVERSPLAAEDPCQDRLASSIAARSRAFGDGYRDLLQAARVQVARVAALAAAPTVAAIVDGRTAARLDALSARIDRHERAYAEMVAWQYLYVAPFDRTCDPELSPAEGLPGRAPVASDDPFVAVAIIGVGGGTVCPAFAPADGRVVIARDGRACLGDLACACEPLPVLPGAVLGPDAHDD